MSVIADAIFANEPRKILINKTHAEIRDIFKGLTLEEVLVVGYNWDRKKIDSVIASGKMEELKQFFRVWEYYGSNESLSQFKLYNQPAITRHARYRADFIRLARSMNIDLTSKLSIPELERLSFIASSWNTVLYAIKCYILANLPRSEWERFNGLQAQTTPVQNANMKLFGKYESPAEHMIRCNQIAKEIGSYPLFVNTALYYLG